MTEMTNVLVDQPSQVADFDYELPPDLIAQTPLAERDASRMLVVQRLTGTRHHAHIRDLPTWLRPGDLLVANNSRVIPARMHATKLVSGGRVELLLLRRDDAGQWTALAKPARRCRMGDRLTIPSRDGGTAAEVEVRAVGDHGQIAVRFLDHADERLAEFGEVPLPPYIHERLADPERYQTTFGTVPGSAAASTAGLHITDRLREAARKRGVGWAEVTLHVGLDTFRPMLVERVLDHPIHREWCEISDEVAETIARTKAAGGRVIAVGTTSVRTLETLGAQWDAERPRGWQGMTDTFIVPGHQWRIVDGLLTNFHLPRSSLLVLVAALAGWDQIRTAYAEAVAKRYRFFSFGDAMLII